MSDPVVDQIAEAIWESSREERLDDKVPPWGKADSVWVPVYHRLAEAVLAVPVIADALAAQKEAAFYKSSAAEIAAQRDEAEAREAEAIRHLRAVMEGPPPPGIRDVAAEAAALFLAGLPDDLQATPSDSKDLELAEAQAKLEAERAEVDRLREALFGLLVFARGNPVVLAKIHGALDGRVEDGGELS